MRILVLEPDHGGHRFAYVRLMLSALHELSQDVVLCTSEAAPGSAEYAVHLAPIAQRFRLDASCPRPGVGALRKASLMMGNLVRTIRQHKPDHVYIPYADGLTQLVVACGSVGWQGIPASIETEGLMLRGGMPHPELGLRGALQFQFVCTLLRRAPWTVAHFLDPTLYALVLRSAVGLAHRSRPMPEPVEPMPTVDKQTARRCLGIPEDGRYIGCCGAMDERKGIDLLLRAFAAARLKSDDRLLLAGRSLPASSGCWRASAAHCWPGGVSARWTDT